MIYVPSRQRAWMLEKTAPTWLAASDEYPHMEVALVVGEDDADDYARELIRLGMEYEIDVLVDPLNVSIGSARQFALEHAASRGFNFHVQVDDDMRVTPNLGLLVEVLLDNPDASGCGAWQSYYGLGMGKTTDASPDVEMNRSSMGLQVKSYRNDVLLEAGGFDQEMRLAEDVDAVMRVARSTGQYPLIHRRVVATSVNARGDAGGCASRGGHSSHAESTVDVLNARYGPGTASVRTHKKTGLPRDTIWMRSFWHQIEGTGKYAEQ